jgi:cell division protein FtsW
MSRAARRHVVGNDVSTLSGFASVTDTVEPADARDTEPTVDPREPAWKRAAADDPKLPAWRRVLAAAKRISAKKAPPVDPTLPVSAQIVAVQNPTVSLPERPYDLILIGAVLALLGIGTIEIYSATAADALTHFHDSLHYLERQLMYMACGGVAMWYGARLDYRRLKAWTYPLLVISLLLLGAALGMPSRNGAKRWIPLGPLTFEPVEIAKLALVTYLACSLGRKAEQIKTFSVGFVPHLVVCGMMMALLLKQPDLGSSVVLGATTLGMLFMAGTRVSYIMLAVLGAAPVAYHLVVGTPWRMQRMLAFFNPDGFANKEAYQFIQARLAIGSGGLFGAGLGGGHQTLGFLPEAHSDFALAPIGEEMGWIGIALVLLLFAILLWRGIRAALGARDVFGGYLAFGITLMLGLQLLFNVSVVLGVLPNKGITLPLVSYGGTSLVTTMFLVGLILNVGRRPDRSPARAGSRDVVRKRRVRVRVVTA